MVGCARLLARGCNPLPIPFFTLLHPLSFHPGTVRPCAPARITTFLPCDDPDWCMMAPDVVDFAIEQGYFDGGRDGKREAQKPGLDAVLSLLSGAWVVNVDNAAGTEPF